MWFLLWVHVSEELAADEPPGLAPQVRTHEPEFRYPAFVRFVVIHSFFCRGGTVVQHARVYN